MLDKTPLCDDEQEQPVPAPVLSKRYRRPANSRLRWKSDHSNAETTTVTALPGVTEFLQAGIKHHRAGDLAAAKACYQKILVAQPNHADALHLLGLIAHQAGQHYLAVKLIHQAIKQNGLNAAYFSTLGATVYVQGKLDEAVSAYRRAIILKPDFAEAYCNLGVALKDQGRLDEAIVAGRQSIAIKPNLAEAHCNIGAALCDQGKLDEAIAVLGQAIRIKPDYGKAHYNLGNALKNQVKLDEAAAAYHQAIRIEPNNADAYCNLAMTLFDQNRHEEAIAACRQAILLKPDFAAAHNNLGLILVRVGQLPEARTALERAVQLAPLSAKHRRNLGDVMCYVAGDPHLATLEQLAHDSAALPVSDRISLHFALAKAYDDLGRHTQAFRQWQEGNAIKRREIVYDEPAMLGVLDRARTVFTSELIQTWQNVGNPSSVPVFIVGMMRSGSTLVEQILSSHPKVFGGDELKYFHRAVQGFKTPTDGSTISQDLVSGMTGEDYRGLGTRYLAEIERLAPGATHITDKMPTNFMFAGLIHLALPNAPIIHTVRDPLDTCLSCFSKVFSEEQNHTYDLGELGRYYRHYQALVEHWHRVLPPGRILDVHYEDVVADLEGQARRIVAHCGLDWDDRCLSFHETVRPVRTASAAQVRQPIYNRAIGRWRAYETFLGPLLMELGAVTPATT